MKTITWVEFFENFVFWKFRIQVRYVVDVPNAVAEATDLKIFPGEGLDVLDFLASIWEKNVWCDSVCARAHVCVWEGERVRERERERDREREKSCHQIYIHVTCLKGRNHLIGYRSLKNWIYKSSFKKQHTQMQCGSRMTNSLQMQVWQFCI